MEKNPYRLTFSCLFKPFQKKFCIKLFKRDDKDWYLVLTPLGYYSDNGLLLENFPPQQLYNIETMKKYAPVILWDEFWRYMKVF